LISRRARSSCLTREAACGPPERGSAQDRKAEIVTHLAPAKKGLACVTPGIDPKPIVRRQHGQSNTATMANAGRFTPPTGTPASRYGILDYRKRERRNPFIAAMVAGLPARAANSRTDVLRLRLRLFLPANYLGSLISASDKGRTFGNDFRKSQPSRSLKSAFPNRQEPPVRLLQSRLRCQVACPVVGDFGGPEVRARRRQLEERAIMAMPEAAM
jgi:hypothetical protein